MLLLYYTILTDRHCDAGCDWSVLLLLFFWQGKPKPMLHVLYSLMSWILLVGRELNLQCIPIQDRQLINFLLRWMGKYLASEGFDWYFEYLGGFFLLTAVIFIFPNTFKDINVRCFYDILVWPAVALMSLM